MDDFRVSVIAGSSIAMLDVEDDIGVQSENICRIAQTDAQSLDGHGLLTASAGVKINVAQVRIDADVIPLRITTDADSQVVIAATTDQRCAGAGISPIEPGGSR